MWYRVHHGHSSRVTRNSTEGVEILVSFLSYQTNIPINEEVLYHVFSQYGRVLDCVVKHYAEFHDESNPRARRQNGYGFVTLQSIDVAQSVIHEVKSSPIPPFLTSAGEPAYHNDEMQPPLVMLDCKLSRNSSSRLQNLLGQPTYTQSSPPSINSRNDEGVAAPPPLTTPSVPSHNNGFIAPTNYNLTGPVQPSYPPTSHPFNAGNIAPPIFPIPPSNIPSSMYVQGNSSQIYSQPLPPAMDGQFYSHMHPHMSHVFAPSTHLQPHPTSFYAVNQSGTNMAYVTNPASSSTTSSHAHQNPPLHHLHTNSFPPVASFPLHHLPSSNHQHSVNTFSTPLPSHTYAAPMPSQISMNSSTSSGSPVPTNLDISYQLPAQSQSPQPLSHSPMNHSSASSTVYSAAHYNAAVTASTHVATTQPPTQSQQQQPMTQNPSTTFTSTQPFNSNYYHRWIICNYLHPWYVTYAILIYTNTISWIIVL